MFPYFDDDFLSFSNSVFNVPRIRDPFECIYRSMNDLIRQTTEAFMADMQVLNAPFNHTLQMYAGPSTPRVCERRIYHRPRRLQEYESNIRRRFSPPPNASGSSIRRAIQYLDQLPISTVQIKNLSSEKDGQTSPNNSTEIAKSSPEYSLIMDRKGKCSKQNLIPIQALCLGPNGRKPECDICLSEYESGHKLRHLPCGHGFHRDCIDTWLSTAETCPKCRKNVVGCLRRLQVKFAAGRSQSVARTNTNTSAVLPTVRATNSDRSSQPPRQRPTVNVHQTRSSILRNRLAEQRRVAEAQGSFLPSFTGRSRLLVPPPTMLQMRRLDHVPGGRPHFQRELVRSVSSPPNKGGQKDAVAISTGSIDAPQNACASATLESPAPTQPIALGYHEEKPVNIETPEQEARRMAVEAALKRFEIARNAAAEADQTQKQDL